MRKKKGSLTANHASSRTRTRASTRALTQAGGARKNFRFTAEMMQDLKVARGLLGPTSTEVGIIAVALARLVGRRRKEHVHRPGDRRQLGRSDRRGASPSTKS